MSVEGLIEQVYRERYLGFRNALAPIVGSREVAHDVVQEAWNDVVARVGTRRPIRHRARLALVAALVLIAIALPTLALSASVRELLGLSHPGPDYKHARLAVSAPIPGGRVARVWVSPSTDGGRCQFVTIDPAGSAHPPTQMTGGGACTLGRAPLQRLVTWSFSRSRHAAAVIDGRVDAKLHATSVELRWRGGAQRLELNDGFFVASAPTLDDPPFARLPTTSSPMQRADRRSVSDPDELPLRELEARPATTAQVSRRARLQHGRHLALQDPLIRHLSRRSLRTRDESHHRSVASPPRSSRARSGRCA